MKFLKQSTSCVVPVGPFVSPTDGVTLVTGLISALDHVSTGIFLIKNGGSGAVRHAAVTATTYDAYGMYLVTLDTTDTGTVGRLRLYFAAAASCLPVWEDFQVLPATMFDSLVTGSGGSIPGAIAGAAGGLFIAGTNAATAITTALTSNIVGDITGSLSGTVAKSPATLAAADVSGNLPAVLANSASHGGAASVITLLTPIAATVPDTQKVDVNTIKTQTLTCAAATTILANVGFAGAPGANTGPPTTDGTKINQTVDLTAGQSIAASSVPAVTLANGAHGGAATVLTFKQLVGANADAGGSVIDLAATGTGNSHGIVINATNGKAMALGSTNSNGVSIDSGAANGLVIVGATGDIVADITGTVSLATGQLAVKKNTALANFQFPMFAAADHVTPLTGLTITATRSIDGGAFAACANSASEIGTSGVYKITLANTDLNGTTILFSFAGGATADTAILGIVTQA